MQTEESKNRCIRMTDKKWDAFKRLLGTRWLDGQVDKAIKREERKAKGDTPCSR